MIERFFNSLENINLNLHSIKYCYEGFVSFRGITLDEFGLIHLQKYAYITVKIQKKHKSVLHNPFMNL